jgi:predicted nucleotidyltransferase
MQTAILSHLNQIEADENVRLVYACESGSRAWGFPSADSDYDVRFIYVHPVDWYLTIDAGRDVIERPINAGLDINGWDLKKALRLFRKSNPPLLEWLGSPIVYLERYSTAARLRELSAVYYSPTASLHHYLHMARRNYREYLHGEVVWVKKYFYVLRPVLAMNWIEQGLGAAPTDFNTLVQKLVSEAALRTSIERLMAAKRAGAELDQGPRIPAISDYLDREMTRWEVWEAAHQQPPVSSAPLDELFRASLAEIWRETP